MQNAMKHMQETAAKAAAYEAEKQASVSTKDLERACGDVLSLITMHGLITVLRNSTVAQKGGQSQLWLAEILKAYDDKSCKLQIPIQYLEEADKILGTNVAINFSEAGKGAVSVAVITITDSSPPIASGVESVIGEVQGRARGRARGSGSGRGKAKAKSNSAGKAPLTKKRKHEGQ